MQVHTVLTFVLVVSDLTTPIPDGPTPIDRTRPCADDSTEQDDGQCRVLVWPFDRLSSYLRGLLRILIYIEFHFLSTMAGYTYTSDLNDFLGHICGSAYGASDCCATGFGNKFEANSGKTMQCLADLIMCS